MLPSYWKKVLDKLDFAFQPIIYTNTGKLFGVEALLRNVKKAGKFDSIFDLFDAAYNVGILYQLDLELRKKALTKFSHIDISGIHLFYNLDNRLMRMSDYSMGNTTKILNELKIEQKHLCFEISERGSIDNPHEISNIVNLYKGEGFNIAIDDYGTGISGMKMLYFSEPNFIKIDRFFIQEIEQDFKKKHFCSSLIDMAHVMGMKVIAEGVETDKEFYTCRDMGFDMIQGYFIQRPTQQIDEIEAISSVLSKLNMSEKRSNNKLEELEKYILRPKTLSENSTMKELFNYFKSNRENIFVPLVDNKNNLVGIIYESDVKHISYSQYGMALAQNLLVSSKLKEFIKPATSVELSWGVDKILDAYSLAQQKEKKEGIFITKDDAYYGFISLNTLLEIVYNKNLFVAKNQNPLSKLPGNVYIEEFIQNCFSAKNRVMTHLVYFDFNDFKPFNDYYGFRKGDRAIILFSEILQKHLGTEDFIGHVGGDDFFVGFTGRNISHVYKKMKTIQKEFRNSILSFYTKDDLDNGYIYITDRHGIKRRFDTMSVACAILEVDIESNIQYLDGTLAMVKKMSKESKKPLAFSLITGSVIDVF